MCACVGSPNGADGSRALQACKRAVAGAFVMALFPAQRTCACLLQKLCHLATPYAASRLCCCSLQGALRMLKRKPPPPPPPPPTERTSTFTPKPQRVNQCSRTHEGGVPSLLASPLRIPNKRTHVKSPTQVRLLCVRSFARFVPMAGPRGRCTSCAVLFSPAKP